MLTEVIPLLTNDILPENREPPQKEVPQQNGFFKLSHGIFGHPLVRDLSGDAFRLFLFLSSKAWRFSSSDGTTRASISFLEVGTGMSHASVSRALRSLRDRKLISLIEQDFKDGNVWHVSPIAFSEGSVAPRFEAAENEHEASSNCGSSSLKKKKKLTQNEVQVRSIKNIQKENKKELAQSEVVHFEQEKKALSESIGVFEMVASWEDTVPKDLREKMIDDYFSTLEKGPFVPSRNIARILMAGKWHRAKATRNA